MPVKTTGKTPSGKQLELLKQSFQYKKNGFENLSETPMTLHDSSYYELLKKMLKRNADVRPPKVLPSVKTDLKHISSTAPFIVWFGHSSYFIRAEGKNFLVDPVFSGYASPVSCMVKAFEGSDAYTVDDLPDIDCLVITHDHYDHLDYKTVLQLRSKTKHVYCSLGISSHLVYWGYDANRITEIDWWQTKQISENVSITAAPARHFSGRGLKRFKTLWSSFILKAGAYNLYLGGDSGYDSHFKSIGEKFGPFDLAILETGQYNEAWPLIHMMPEQTVQAGIELGAKLLLPVHWSKFTLALHSWDDPIKRVLKSAAETGLSITTPMIGEPVMLNESHPDSKWWNI